MNEMQNKMRSMLEWFHDFCVKHDLRYYLIGGTLLGAVRHKGFIPWDDDVDVGMPRPDYERFLTLEKQYNSSQYRAETIYDGNRDYIYVICKIYDTTTTLIDRTKYKTKRGIFLDVIPLDGVGDTLEEGRRYYKKMRRKQIMISVKVRDLRKDRPFVQNAAIIAAHLLPYSWRKAAVKYNELCKKKDYYSCAYIADLPGAARVREVVPREWFDEPVSAEFEGLTVWIPREYDKYLSWIYGDYMTLPPVEKRVSPHNAILIDLNKSYIAENDNASEMVR